MVSFADIKTFSSPSISTISEISTKQCTACQQHTGEMTRWVVATKGRDDYYLKRFLKITKQYKHYYNKYIIARLHQAKRPNTSPPNFMSGLRIFPWRDDGPVRFTLELRVLHQTANSANALTSWFLPPEAELLWLFRGLRYANRAITVRWLPQIDFRGFARQRADKKANIQPRLIWETNADEISHHDAAAKCDWKFQDFK